MKYKFIFIFLASLAPYFVLASIGPEWCGDNCGWDDLITLANKVITYILTIATILAVISFMWAGFLLITAGGNESKVKQAKEIFGNVVVGLIFAYGAWIIVHFIFAALGGKSNFSLLQ